MKAITLHAPWAWAICYLGKDIENRTWKPPAELIGQRIAIHAGSKSLWKWRIWQPVLDLWDVIDQSCTWDKINRYGSSVDSFRSVKERDRFCSAIVATAVIAEVLPPQDTDAGWHIAGQYGWKLTDVQVLPTPVKCKGKLGFWTVPAEVESQMQAGAP